MFYFGNNNQDTQQDLDSGEGPSAYFNRQKKEEP